MGIKNISLPVIMEILDNDSSLDVEVMVPTYGSIKIRINDQWYFITGSSRVHILDTLNSNKNKNYG